jgi:transcriptional regulator with XRE-family HTH domain
MVDMETLGDRLRNLRTSHGDTQGTLANIAGVTKQAISKIELTGAIKSASTTLEPIARHYGVSLNWLLTGTGAKASDPAQLGQSQTARLTPAMIAETAKAVRVDEHRQGRRFSIETDEGAALFMHWLAVREQLPDVETLSNLLRMGGNFMPQGATEDGRSKGVSTTGTDEKKPANRGA